MKISWGIVAILLTSLWICGCQGQFDPQKNMLSSKCFGWWTVEIAPSPTRPGHIMFVQLRKDGATVYDCSQGFGTRAIGTYAFQQGSKHGQGTFDLYLAGKAMHTDQYIGNWKNRFEYERSGLKYSLKLVVGDESYPLTFKYKDRNDELVQKDIDNAVQDFLKKYYSRSHVPEPQSAPAVPRKV